MSKIFFNIDHAIDQIIGFFVIHNYFQYLIIVEFINIYTFVSCHISPNLELLAQYTDNS